MQIRSSFLTGCIHAFLSVSLGAFGAHALKERISSEMLEIYNTGIQYQMFHAIGLFIVAFASLHVGDRAELRWATWLFNIGIMLFAGSLYVLAITEIRALGAITPFGGVAFLAGWTLLALSMRAKHKK